MTQTSWNEPSLKPCPFCGGDAEIERYGDRHQSTIYLCGECGCRLETGEEWGYGTRWNERADPVSANLPSVEEIMKCLELFSFRRGLSGMIAHHQVPELAQTIVETFNRRPVPDPSLFPNKESIDPPTPSVEEIEQKMWDLLWAEPSPDGDKARVRDVAEAARAVYEMIGVDDLRARAEKAEHDLYICRLAKAGEMERAEEYRAELEEYRNALEKVAEAWNEPNPAANSAINNAMLFVRARARKKS